MAARVVVFLLLGAAVNVAVAWACSLWSPLPGRWHVVKYAALPEDLQFIPPDWLLIPREEHLTLMLRTENAESFGLSMNIMASLVHYAMAIDIGPGRIVQIYRAGWPWHSLECHAVVIEDGPWILPGPPRLLAWHGGAEAPSMLHPQDTDQFFSPERSLPWRIRPLPMLADTMIYAATLWLFFAAPLAFRRRRRIRRGLCPACAYPIGANDLCTECGKPVRAKAGSATQKAQIG